MDFGDAVKLLTVAFLAAITAVGIISWIKAGFDLFSSKDKRTVKAIVAWGLVPIAAFLAAVTFDGGIWRMLAVGGLAFAFIQVCYETIYKFILTLVEWLQTSILSKKNGVGLPPPPPSKDEGSGA